MSDKVKISDAIDTIDSNIAASLKAVKIAYDKANEANEIANLARSSASSASTSANTARNTANTALSEARDAKSIANNRYPQVQQTKANNSLPSGGTWTWISIRNDGTVNVTGGTSAGGTAADGRSNYYRFAVRVS